MFVPSTVAEQDRTTADSWWRYGRALAALLVVAAGCQVQQPARRPLDDIVRETLAAAARQHAGQTDAAAGPALPRSGRAAPARLPPLDEPHAHGTPPVQSEPYGFAEAATAGPLSAVQPAAHRHTGAWLPSAEGAAGPTLVTDIFEETDIRQAIQSLATQARVSVIIDEQVGGVATAVIEEEDFESALQKLLLPAGYVWRKKDGRYLVGTTDPESSLFRLLAEKREYQPQHNAPEELKSLLPDKLQQYARIVGKRNLIVIDAPGDIADQILQELEQVDLPVPQVVIEAIVAVFAPETSFQYGLDLQQLHGDHDDNGLHVSLSGLALSGALSPAASGKLFGNFAVTSYFLRNLAQEGYVEIRAAPRVMAKNGEKAQISIARETFFSTQPGNAEFFFRQDIEKVESGISLDIIPVIRGDNITVTIERAEVSEDIRESGSDPNLASPFPLINRRTVSTTVNVKDGETIVIGGLTHRQMVDRVSRIPFLSDLPKIGHLFEQVDQQEQEAEVAVFISPRIVYAGQQEVLPIPHAAPPELE